MAVEDRHPDYLQRIDEWRRCSDCLSGQQAIKEATTAYLPIPSGFAGNPDRNLGALMYESYLERAQFVDVYSQTLLGMVGLVHRQEAVVEGLEGTPLESMHESCTRPDQWPKLTLMAFHQRITEELLNKGRVAVLPDASSRGSQTPWLSLYTAESLTNWAPDGSMYVLDESGLIRSDLDEFTWRFSRRFRVLRMLDGEYTGQVYADIETDDDTPDEIADRAAGARVISEQRGRGAAAPGSPRDVPPGVTGPRNAEVMAPPTGRTARGSAAIGQEVYTPKSRTGKPMSFIPLVVGGAIRMGLEPEAPPLIGVANASVSMYQLSADYRHQLFMSGQETMYAVGVEQQYMPKVVGAGVVVGIPLGGSLGYASPSCTGIEAHSKAINDEKMRAVAAGVQLFDQGGSQQSGDALRIRYGAQTATLITVARQSAAILESALRNAAHMLKMPQEQIDAITVKPNTEFLETVMSPQDAQTLMQVWMGGGISYQTFYENLVRGGIESGERTADEEQELIDEESPDVPSLGGGGDLVPTAGASTGLTDGGGGSGVAEAGDGTEAGPESVTDDEISQMFGEYADDVV